MRVRSRSYATLRGGRHANSSKAIINGSWDLHHSHGHSCPSRGAFCCLKWWGLAVAMAAIAGSVTHWVSSDNGLVVPKVCRAPDTPICSCFAFTASAALHVAHQLASLESACCFLIACCGMKSTTFA